MSINVWEFFMCTPPFEQWYQPLKIAPFWSKIALLSKKHHQTGLKLSHDIFWPKSSVGNGLGSVYWKLLNLQLFRNYQTLFCFDWFFCFDNCFYIVFAVTTKVLFLERILSTKLFLKTILKVVWSLGKLQGKS